MNKAYIYLFYLSRVLFLFVLIYLIIILLLFSFSSYSIIDSQFQLIFNSNFELIKKLIYSIIHYQNLLFILCRNFIIIANCYIYFFLFILISYISCYIISKTHIKLFYKYLFYIITFTTEYVIFFNLLFVNLKFFYILTLLLLYIIVLYINSIKSNILIKILILIPFLSEILLPEHIINNINNKVSKLTKKYICLLSITVLFSLSFSCIFYLKPNDNNFCIEKNSSYSIEINKKNDSTLITLDTKKALFIIDKENNKKILQTNFKTNLQNFVYNEENEEYYYYQLGKLYIYKIFEDKLLCKKEKQILNDNNINLVISPFDNPRITFDNNSKTIGIVIEHVNKIYILDMKTLEIVNDKNIDHGNDFIIYNPFRNSFLISYWFNGNKKGFISELSLQDNEIKQIPMERYQGYMCISKKNKELYIAYNQKGKIYVYDASSYKLKRKIKSKYSVKNITYDEDLNILIAPSYFYGYIDIFLIDSINNNDKLIYSINLNTILREAKLSPNKKKLFCTSPFGIYEIDIEKIIKDFVK